MQAFSVIPIQAEQQDGAAAVLPFPVALEELLLWQFLHC